MFECIGILREVQNSPNRESDDALVLKAVLARLEDIGARARLLSPEDADREALEADVVLPMCESYPRLKRLEERAKSSKALWVNGPASVFNCYRARMVELLGPSGLLPPSELRRVDSGAGRPPFDSPGGWWLKRGDVHNTCDRDVVFVASWPRAGAVLEDFAAREITHYVAQPHVDGDLIKFYGVGPERWFTWFYHDSVRARRLPFAVDDLADAAARGARTLGLEVFGGDAIIGPGGAVTLIDLNSWPSFAKVRGEAAVQIAWHLQTRATGAARRKR